MNKQDIRIPLGNWIAPEACLGALVSEDVVVFRYEFQGEVRPARSYFPQVDNSRHRVDGYRRNRSRINI